MIAMKRFSAAALIGTAGLMWLLAPGLGAQQPTEPMPGMHERMQSMESMMQHMHQMMMSMHGGGAGQENQAMPGMQGQQRTGMGMGMPAQQGAGTMSAESCSMPDGLEALLRACPSNLALTEAQTTALDAILERARSEALATLTPEQHAQLHTAQGQMGAAGQGGAAPH